MIAPLPPPIHGSAMMTQYIKNSQLLNDAFDLDWINLSTSRKMEEIGKNSIAKIFRFLSSYFISLWKLGTKRYDACYIALTCHGLGFIKDAPFALLCKFFGRKLIIHQHNKGMSNDVEKPFIKWLLKKVYKNATVILLSWRLYPDIQKIVQKDQVRICPNGIPESRIFKKNTEPHMPRILFLSNLMESKGVFTLLDACKILKDKGYKFECRFVGSETKEIDKDKFHHEVMVRNLDDSVFYLGRKYGDDKNLEFANSDIFVFPSFYETFGLVLLEAMQQSTPVIGSDEGSMPDIIQHGINGLISTKRDPVALANNISRLIDDPVFARALGKAGYKNYLDNYTLDKWENTLKAQIFSAI